MINIHKDQGLTRENQEEVEEVCSQDILLMIS